MSVGTRADLQGILQNVSVFLFVCHQNQQNCILGDRGLELGCGGVGRLGEVHFSCERVCPQNLKTRPPLKPAEASSPINEDALALTLGSA